MSIDDVCDIKRILDRPGAFEFYHASDLIDDFLYYCMSECDGYERNCPYMTPSEYKNELPDNSYK